MIDGGDLFQQKQTRPRIAQGEGVSFWDGQVTACREISFQARQAVGRQAGRQATRYERVVAGKMRALLIKTSRESRHRHGVSQECGRDAVQGRGWSDRHIHFCAPACTICCELQHCVQLCVQYVVCNCVQHSVCTQDSGRVCVQIVGWSYCQVVVVHLVEWSDY